MISARIAGATRVLGKSQGYSGLAIRDQVTNCTVNGDGAPEMVTAWEPTPSEIEAIKAGALVYVHILGTSHPPIMVEVATPPSAGDGNGALAPSRDGGKG